MPHRVIRVIDYRKYITVSISLQSFDRYNSVMTTFSSLFGQDGVIGSLQRALASDTLAGSYLFVGTTGVGKGTLARAFAQAAACLNPRSEPFDSCGECESCRREALGTQPEIVTIHPAGEQMQIWQY